jgi:23S rRNA (uracil1939-C5)-methyltransferase
MNPIFEVQLEKLTYGGDAMGRLPGGRAVFVPFGLPGERVRVRLTEEKKNFARGELVEVLEPSPDRIAPKCKHFFSLLPTLEEGSGMRAACGGCHYQHLPYPKQLEAKAEILRDQLTRIGKIENPNVTPMVASPSEWNYRNHIQFHLTEEGKLGFVSALTPGPSPEYGRGVQVIPISECHLPEASLNAFWPELQFDSESEAERVSLRAGREDELMLILESDSPEPPELEIEADISAVHLFEDHSVVMAGQEYLTIRVLGRDFRVSAASFFQVNTRMAEKMVEHLLSTLPVSANDALLDLYCGVGLFSSFFASRAERVIGIESSPSACEDFVVNLDEFENVELYEGAAEEIIPGLVAQVSDLRYAVVDPPRAGLERRVVDALQALGPRVIAYVSCDPSTLARDSKRLIEGGYRLKQVTPFDLFPQTYHIESISIFEKL